MDIPPWCVKSELPPTGMSAMLSVVAVVLLMAGVAAVLVSRRSRSATLVMVVLASAVVVGSFSSPTSAADRGDCPAGYVLINGLGVVLTATPEPGLWARTVRDYSVQPGDKPTSQSGVPDATFAVNVDVKSGRVETPLVIKVRRPNVEIWKDASGVTGAGWSVESAGDFYQLTFTPTEATSVVPQAVVTFTFGFDAYFESGNPDLKIEPQLPSGVVGRAVGGEVAIDQITVVFECTSVPAKVADFYWDLTNMRGGLASRVIGGTSPYTFSSTDLTGFAFDAEGRLVHAGGALDKPTAFTVTIADSSGEQLTIDAQIRPIWIYLPASC